MGTRLLQRGVATVSVVLVTVIFDKTILAYGASIPILKALPQLTVALPVLRNVVADDNGKGTNRLGLGLSGQ